MVLLRLSLLSVVLCLIPPGLLSDQKILYLKLYNHEPGVAISDLSIPGDCIHKLKNMLKNVTDFCKESDSHANPFMPCPEVTSNVLNLLKSEEKEHRNCKAQLEATKSLLEEFLQQISQARDRIRGMFDIAIGHKGNRTSLNDLLNSNHQNLLSTVDDLIRGINKWKMNTSKLDVGYRESEALEGCRSEYKALITDHVNCQQKLSKLEENAGNCKNDSLIASIKALEDKLNECQEEKQQLDAQLINENKSRRALLTMMHEQEKRLNQSVMRQNDTIKVQLELEVKIKECNNKLNIIIEDKENCNKAKSDMEKLIIKNTTELQTILGDRISSAINKSKLLLKEVGEKYEILRSVCKPFVKITHSKTTELDRCEKEKSKLDQERSDFKNSLEACENAKHTLTGDVNVAQNSLSSYNDMIKQQKFSIDQIRSENAQLRQNINRVTEIAQRCSASLQEEKETNKNRMTKTKGLENQLRLKGDRVNELEKDKVNLNEKLNGMEEALKKVRKQKEEALMNVRKEKQEALEKAKNEQEEALDNVRKEKEEALERVRKEKKEVLENFRKEKEEALESVRKEKEEALEKAKKEKKEALENARKEKEEALEWLRKENFKGQRTDHIEEALERLRKEKEEALEKARKEKEEALEDVRKEKEEALEKVRKEKEEALEELKLKDSLLYNYEKDLQNVKGQSTDHMEKALEKVRKEKEEALEKARREKEAALQRVRKENEETLEKIRKENEEVLGKVRKEKEEALEKAKFKDSLLYNYEKDLRNAKEQRKDQMEEELEKVRKEKEEALEKARKEKEEALEKVRKEKEEALEKLRLKDSLLYTYEKDLDIIKGQRTDHIEEELEKVRKEKEEALERARKEKEEVLEKVRKEKEEALKKVRKEKEEALEKVRKEKEQALEEVRKQKEEALEKLRLKDSLLYTYEKDLDIIKGQRTDHIEEELEKVRKEKEEALERARKEKEEALEKVRKEKEESLEKFRKENEAELEKVRKEKDEALENSKLKDSLLYNYEKDLYNIKDQRTDHMEEALEKVRKEKEEALENARKQKEEALEKVRKENEVALEKVRKENEEALENVRKQKEEALEKVRKEKEEALEKPKLEDSLLDVYEKEHGINQMLSCDERVNICQNENKEHQEKLREELVKSENNNTNLRLVIISLTKQVENCTQENEKLQAMLLGESAGTKDPAFTSRETEDAQDYDSANLTSKLRHIKITTTLSELKIKLRHLEYLMKSSRNKMKMLEEYGAILTMLVGKHSEMLNLLKENIDGEDEGPPMTASRLEFLLRKLMRLVENHHSMMYIQQLQMKPYTERVIPIHIRRLVQRGRHPNAALLSAAVQGNLTEVGVLLDVGANVNVKDAVGLTPLHWAAKAGHAYVAELLLSRGADPNNEAKATAIKTPLHLAAEHGHSEAVLVLLDFGANIEARALDYATPLLYAAHSGKVEVVRILLERGANIRATNALNKGILELAVNSPMVLRAVKEYKDKL